MSHEVATVVLSYGSLISHGRHCLTSHGLYSIERICTPARGEFYQGIYVELISAACLPYVHQLFEHLFQFWYDPSSWQLILQSDRGLDLISLKAPSRLQSLSNNAPKGTQFVALSSGGRYIAVHRNTVTIDVYDKPNNRAWRCEGLGEQSGVSGKGILHSGIFGVLRHIKVLP